MSEILRGAELAARGAIDCDVVVVGSGAGGAVATYELAAAGLDVVCLEAGPHVRPEEFTQRELDTIERVYVEAAAQGPADGSIKILQGAAIGGSTLVNAEVCFRIPEAVLGEWGLPAGEMASIFEHVETMIHATVNEGRYLESGKMPSTGLRELGADPKPLTRNVKGCRGCSYCLFGCAYGCKQSTDQSYVPAAIEKGARVVCEAPVERIQLAGGGARGVVARAGERDLIVRSRAVVLACGAIATPLLLLDHRLGGKEIGRHLAVQPTIVAGGIYPEPMPDDPAAMLSYYSDAWADEGYLIELAVGPIPYTAYAITGFGRRHKELARQARNTSFVAGITRDVEMPGRVKRGRKGRKVIDYPMTEPGRERLRRAMRRAAEIHFAGGATAVSLPTTDGLVLESRRDLDAIDRVSFASGSISMFSYHPQGTARLGTVTDADAQVRGVRDLYVMDASLFPTPAGVNTQVPVMSVATLMARRLAARLAG